MTGELSPRALGTPRGSRQSDEKHCFSCGRIVHASATACPSCGAAQPINAAAPLTEVPLSGLAHGAFCYGCGARMHASALACPACGAPQRAAARPGTSKDRTTAIVLAFLLGGIGAHRFYLGQVGIGLVYLLFSWTLVPTVIAVIEGFIYISQSDEAFARRYN